MFLPWPCGNPGLHLKVSGVLGVAAVLCSCFCCWSFFSELEGRLHKVFNSGSNTGVQVPNW